MIGPKQFEIGHKIKPRRKLDNPIVNKIFEPKFKYREDELKTLMESFTDQFKFPEFEVKEDDSNFKPLTKDISFKPSIHENDFKTRAGSFLDKFNFNRLKEVKPESPKPKNKEAKAEISDELINRLTYQVFQNIKAYLNNDNKESQRCNIKIDISM